MQLCFLIMRYGRQYYDVEKLFSYLPSRENAAAAAASAVRCWHSAKYVNGVWTYFVAFWIVIILSVILNICAYEWAVMAIFVVDNDDVVVIIGGGGNDDGIVDDAIAVLTATGCLAFDIRLIIHLQTHKMGTAAVCVSTMTRYVERNFVCVFFLFSYLFCRNSENSESERRASTRLHIWQWIDGWKWQTTNSQTKASVLFTHRQRLCFCLLVFKDQIIFFLFLLLIFFKTNERTSNC